MRDKKINVLIFPAGEINSVELHNALSTNVNIVVYGASSTDRHGPYIFKNYISGIPMITDNNFISEFNKVLTEYKIDLIFPTHDTVADYFAKSASLIQATIAVANSRTAYICRDKERTYSLFSGEDFTPIVYTKNDYELPMFTKPKEGQGSIGAKKIDNLDELAFVDEHINVLTEYLPGEEYTVDCLTDNKGRLVIVSPRSRVRTFGGVSVAGQTHDVSDEFVSIAKKINSQLDFKGLWFFQVKRDKNSKLKLLEISSRCAGTMCLTRVRGANLPLLTVYTFMGIDVEPLMNDLSIELDRTLINRYKMDYQYDTVYYDFDDTIVINDKVHLPAMQFLYQCKNNNIKVHMLTRHELEIEKTLKQHSIDRTLFETIISIGPNEKKADYITERNAIFIDNAFSERRDVRNAKNIPVFDVDAIELLLDWRC